MGIPVNEAGPVIVALSYNFRPGLVVKVQRCASTLYAFVAELEWMSGVAWGNDAIDHCQE